MTEKQVKNKAVWKKACILPIFLIVLCATSLVANAYLRWSAKVENTFTAEVSKAPAVKENFADNTKSDVAVNAGETDYSVYVRAAIVAVWVNEHGEVHANIPVPGVDYELTLNVDADGSTDKDWFEKDGFYYHKAPVAGKADTEQLISSCTPLKAAPLDKENPTTNIYKLKVDIAAQTIQAAGMTDGTYDGDGNQITAPIPAVTAQWGIDVDANKQLKK